MIVDLIRYYINHLAEMKIRGVCTFWVKILNRKYLQKQGSWGREELFERERQMEPVAGWHSCVIACAEVEAELNSLTVPDAREHACRLFFDEE
jgi:hypothetical protein